MKERFEKTIVSLTKKLKKNIKSCPLCPSENLKIQTEFTESLERDSDVLTKHCQCSACGFIWEESYTITLHEAVPVSKEIYGSISRIAG